MADSNKPSKEKQTKTEESQKKVKDELKDVTKQLEKELEFLVRLKVSKIFDRLSSSENRESTLLNVLKLPKGVSVKEELEKKLKDFLKKNDDLDIS